MEKSPDANERKPSSPETRQAISEVMGNVKLPDRILSRINMHLFHDHIKKHIPRLARSIALNLKTTKNWLEMTLVETGHKAQADATFRDGTLMEGVSSKNIMDFRLKRYTKRLKLEISFGAEHVQFSFNGRSLDFKHAEEGFGTIAEVFFHGEYSALHVAGKDVLDVGANVGDSPIYFALGGAKRVIALEPYPYAHRFAEENVAKNHPQGIVLLNAGISEKPGEAVIDPEFVSNGSSPIRDFNTGKKVRMYALSELVEAYGLKNAALKLDCEGGEYGALLPSTNETLRAFSEIIVEYHKGYLDLEKKLLEAGFSVRHLKRPIYYISPERGPTMRGMLFAERIG